MDDMLVKSKRVDSNLDDLRESFDTLRKTKPNKCVFGVSLGKFLGFMVS